MGTCKSAEHLCPFLDFEASLAEEYQFFMFGGYGWCVDDETRFGLATGVWNFVDVLLVMDEHALLLELMREGRGGLVVACHNETSVYEVAGDGTHAYTACTYEVYSFNIF